MFSCILNHQVQDDERISGMSGWAGLGCGRGRTYPGGQTKLKSNENTRLFNSFLENVAKTTVFQWFLNIARNRKTCRPELITSFAT